MLGSFSHHVRANLGSAACRERLNLPAPRYCGLRQVVQVVPSRPNASGEGDSCLVLSRTGCSKSSEHSERSWFFAFKTTIVRNAWFCCIQMRQIQKTLANTRWTSHFLYDCAAMKYHPNPWLWTRWALNRNTNIWNKRPWGHSTRYE